MIKRYLLLAIVCVAAQVMFSQHYWGVAANGGLQFQLDNLANTHARVGGVGAIGANYYYRFKNYMLYTGAELSLSSVSQGVDSTLYEKNNTRYRLYDRRDVWNAPAVAIPLMIGMDWNNWYAMVGAKAYYSFKGTTKVCAMYDSNITGDQYYEDFLQDMSHHTLESKGTGWGNIQIRARIEAGWHGIYYKDPIVRIGLFAEYGLNNIMPRFSNTSGSGLYYYSPHTRADIKLTNLSVGVKVAVLLKINSNQGRGYWID
ncbi:MAG: hypothetical protein J6R26_04290 [Paludibacteraceae bacterium]|nr:hypothetical protein [Paludibacteraceae bacterium]